jgi:hypothetical protein
VKSVTDIVYVLINEAMSGYVKVGRTDNLEQRIRTLDNTSVPLPFECFYAARVKDAVFVERQLHDAFADARVRKNREYFSIDPERVVAALQLVVLEDVTPGRDFVESSDDQKALDKARERRAVFNFRLVDIPVGATLAFTRNSDITCEVVTNRKVRFAGEVPRLSFAAQKALEGEGVQWKAVQGPAYWEFEGETLNERRARLELEN